MKTERAVAQDHELASSRHESALNAPAAGLNVAVLVDSISAEYGGPSYSVRRLWQSAMDRGVNVKVHSSDRFKVFESAADRRLWQPLDCCQWPSTAFRSLGFSKEMAGGVGKSLINGASVISQHGLWLHYGRVALNLGSSKKVPVIIHPHGMLEPWALKRSSWKKRIVGRLWEYENLRRAVCLRVTSEEELRTVRSLGLTNPVALIPHGIDVADFESLPSREEAEKLLPGFGSRRVLLFLSRVHPKKGLPLLLKAWQALGNERADWVVVIAGQDEAGHTAELKRLAADLNLEDSVTFAGPRFGTEKLAAYALADLFVLPSHSENFGVAIAEALAAGLPVVTTKGTPWQGLTKHGCGWWVDNNVEALTEALAAAVSHSHAELAQMGAKGRAWMKRDFAWERLAADMLEVCQWTLNPGPAPSCVVLD